MDINEFPAKAQPLIRQAVAAGLNVHAEYEVNRGYEVWTVHIDRPFRPERTDMLAVLDRHESLHLAWGHQVGAPKAARLYSALNWMSYRGKRYDMCKHNSRGVYSEIRVGISMLSHRHMDPEVRVTEGVEGVDA